ncbi:hypothetical protein LPB79_27740 [Rhizobium sp. T136]|uniref:hypothetical protein n=1 Tax=Rhizobium sp. T136 TaxID=555319 RepID=UPI001E43DF76|nr:hypothetical protein [Rhizobium sp. T136]UFS82031.1 hypothetical protein LPB79_27740 [Rhizobium sp. T136]
MGRRVFIGNDAGVMKFRATNMSTIDSRYADISQLTIHEQMAPMVPKDSGQITFGGAGSANVGLTKSYSYPPFILLKSSIGVVPVTRIYGPRSTSTASSLQSRHGSLTP